MLVLFSPPVLRVLVSIVSTRGWQFLSGYGGDAHFGSAFGLCIVLVLGEPREGTGVGMSGVPIGCFDADHDTHQDFCSSSCQFHV